MHPDDGEARGGRPRAARGSAKSPRGTGRDTDALPHVPGQPVGDGSEQPPDPGGSDGTPGTGTPSPDQTRWWIYRGTGRPLYDTSLRELLPDPPPWRRFTGAPVVPPPPSDDEEIERRLGRFASPALTSGQLRREADMVNAALYLRRPLLVTGRPGTGKSSLAYRISRELRLGRVLRWHITSRTTLRSGLYEYDAIGRVQDSAALRTLEGVRDPAALRTLAGDAAPPGTPKPGPAAAPNPGLAAAPNPGPAAAPEPEPGGPGAPAPGGGADAALPGIGDYLQLGPLGTALLPHETPRVLLIDELDKCDQDLANDLLSVFEEGQFPVPELLRVRRRHPRVSVLTDDPRGSADIVDGIVRCRAFPVVIITSNGEREFPPAFLRRCLRLDMPDPDHSQLVDMVAAHLTESTVTGTRGGELIGQFLQRSRERGGLAVDQLLNSVFLATSGRFPEGDGEEALQELVDALWHRLDGAGAESRTG
ncbi:AAA family ATPase [Streptomyces sp. NPDC055078]